MAASGDEDLLSLLNTAQSIGALLNLGLTEGQARALLEYRQEHGPFSSVEEILQVKGIGERTLAKLRLWGPAGGYPRSPRPAPRAKTETSSLTRPQGLLIGGLLAIPLYFIIVSIGNNGRGAYIAMAVVGSLIGFLLLLIVIADLVGELDSQTARGAGSLFGTPLILGIVLALVAASNQIPTGGNELQVARPETQVQTQEEPSQPNSRPAVQGSSTEAAPQEGQGVKTLKARIFCNGMQITIINDDLRAWTNVRIELNPGLFSSGYTLKVPRIEAGQSVTYSLLDFTDWRGNRFNPFAKAVREVNILEFSDPWPDQYNLEGMVSFVREGG